jgi:hypothetical protein
MSTKPILIIACALTTAVADFPLALPQRVHDAVDPIARDSEDSVCSPVDQALDQNVSSGGCHGLSKAKCPEAHAEL